MFATSQHAHFIGIGGIGMSGIAEILLNLGMKVSGSDLRRGPVTDRLAQLGATIYEGHEAGHVAGATVVVTSSAVGASQSRSRRGPRPQDSRHSARRDAGRTDAPEIRHRHRRHAWQDHHHIHGGQRALCRRPRSDRSRGRPRGCSGLERPPGDHPISGGRGRRERPLLPQALAHSGRGHQSGSRAHGLLPRHGRRGAMLFWLSWTGCRSTAL
jgi:hypothetical protein